MIHVKLNYWHWIVVLESISANRNISITWQYLKPFNCVQTNELWLV